MKNKHHPIRPWLLLHPTVVLNAHANATSHSTPWQSSNVLFCDSCNSWWGRGASFVCVLCVFLLMREPSSSVHRMSTINNHRHTHCLLRSTDPKKRTTDWLGRSECRWRCQCNHVLHGERVGRASDRLRGCVCALCGKRWCYIIMTNSQTHRDRDDDSFPLCARALRSVPHHCIGRTL